MKCLIWRQHRGQLLWTAVVLVAVAVGTALVAHSANQWLSSYHAWQRAIAAAGCPVPADSGVNQVIHVDATCKALLAKYPSYGAQPVFAHKYNFAIVVFEEGIPLLMVLLGVLLGAPIVARELEQRTQLVAWTQSVGRGRWYAAKSVTIASSLALAGIVAGIANDRLQIPLTSGGLTTSRWPWFFSMDVTLAAEGVLAFALAVALGAWLRHTLAAIGVALVCWLLIFVATAWAIRNVTPVRHAASDRGIPDSSWLLGGNNYHPAGQYWPLQTVYTVALLCIASLLLWSGWRATRTRGV
jgi:hypothetical protein